MSGSSIRVVEGTLGGEMRCGSAAAPLEAAAGTKVSDPGAVARTLKSLLARIEVTQTRAHVATGDALATFRVVRVPATSNPREIDAAVAKELSFDPQQTATKWVEVVPSPERIVYAAAWDKQRLKNVTEAVRLAGVEPVVVELKSASVARAVAIQSCVVLDLESDPAEIILVDEHLPQVWHSFALNAALGDEAAAHLAGPLRWVLRYYKRQSNGRFASTAPVFIASEQAIPADVLSRLAELVEQPVAQLPPPGRVPANVRHPTYLVCLGLLMRRS